MKTRNCDATELEKKEAKRAESVEGGGSEAAGVAVSHIESAHRVSSEILQMDVSSKIR